MPFNETFLQQVLELKNNRKNESFTSAWSSSTNSAWPAEEKHVAEPVADNRDVAPAGFLRYRAVYEFYARNSDEITFQPGDIIMVALQQTGEEGWLSGEIGGHTGWFPEAYVEKIDDGGEELTHAAAVDVPAAG